MIFEDEGPQRTSGVPANRASVHGNQEDAERCQQEDFISFDGFIHRFKRRVLLSATPNPEGYQNLFSQEAIIDQRRRFGDNITSFRDQYCKRDRSGFGYEVIPAYEPMIEEKMKHVMYLPKYDDYLGLPDPIHRAFKVPWNEEERAQYDELEDTLALMIDAAEREEEIPT